MIFTHVLFIYRAATYGIQTQRADLARRLRLTRRDCGYYTQSVRKCGFPGIVRWYGVRVALFQDIRGREYVVMKESSTEIAGRWRMDWIERTLDTRCTLRSWRHLLPITINVRVVLYNSGTGVGVPRIRIDRYGYRSRVSTYSLYFHILQVYTYYRRIDRCTLAVNGVNCSGESWKWLVVKYKLFFVRINRSVKPKSGNNMYIHNISSGRYQPARRRLRAFEYPYLRRYRYMYYNIHLLEN